MIIKKKKKIYFPLMKGSAAGSETVDSGATGWVRRNGLGTTILPTRGPAWGAGGTQELGCIAKGMGWGERGPRRKKGHLPDGEQGARSRGLGTGKRLESRWTVVIADDGQVDWEWMSGQEGLQPWSQSKDRKLKCLLGPGWSPTE